MKEVLSYPLERFKPDVNARTDFGSEEELRGLGMDMKLNGQQMPCLIDPDDILLDGYRRLAAAKLVGLPTLDCIRMPKKFLGVEAKKLQLASVLHRKDLTSWEKAVSAKEIKAANPGMTNKQLAEEVFHIDASGLTRLLAVWLCIQEVQDAFREGKISVSDVYAISQSPEQAATLTLKLKGVPVGKAKAAVKPKPSGDEPPSSTPKVKTPLAVNTEALTANGTVTVAGLPNEPIDLDGVEDLLNAALKAVKDAKKKGYTTKTFANAMKDMAAAAG